MILVVDDEAPIRDATRGVLEANGYRVLLARSGEEALTIIIENLGALRLVLTDMMMPGMDGLALIRSLRILETDIQVIATSGLAQERNRAELATLGVTEVLAKPYAPELLLKAIDTVLAR
jgi:CheY-like chemotaxis protein